MDAASPLPSPSSASSIWRPDSFYLMNSKDRDGKALDKASSYHLAVPAKAEVTQYWSATTYDRATHAFIRGMERFQSFLPEL